MRAISPRARGAGVDRQAGARAAQPDRAAASVRRGSRRPRALAHRACVASACARRAGARCVCALLGAGIPPVRGVGAAARRRPARRVPPPRGRMARSALGAVRRGDGRAAAPIVAAVAHGSRCRRSRCCASWAARSASPTTTGRGAADALADARRRAGRRSAGGDAELLAVHDLEGTRGGRGRSAVASDLAREGPLDEGKAAAVGGIVSGAVTGSPRTWPPADSRSARAC